MVFYPHTRCSVVGAALGLLCTVLLGSAANAQSEVSAPATEPAVAAQPNIVLIFADDAGYGDFSSYGSPQIATPFIDSIGAAGVRCTDAYVTCSVCGPSRAGILTGRYQQRFGAEFNIQAELSDTRGLPEDEVTIAEGLNTRGYRSIMLGKWHLGYGDKFHPLSHGFADFFGFLKGARPYKSIEGDELNRLLLDREPYPESFEYMTDELGLRAAGYIDQHAADPFFLYLAPNAVHQPMHARPELLRRVTLELGLMAPRRQRYIAMMWSLDEMVGTVLAALERNGLSENTLVFFVNDNGGAARNGSSNGDLRGTKGTPFEGGVRVPFLMQWPARLEAGGVYTNPVSALDVLATAWAAAGVEADEEHPLDGVDLMPYFTGANEGRPHETLYWRRGDDWAVRHGDWKLLGYRGGERAELYHLGNDRSEMSDLSKGAPKRAQELGTLYQAWNATLVEPAWGRATGPNDGARGALGDPNRRAGEGTGEAAGDK